MPTPSRRTATLAASPIDVPSLACDTVSLPGTPSDRAGDTVVRPALAVLYRIAVGPGADRYAPRFLSFERHGRPRPGWHWPALVAPAAWAFYRRLWGAGMLCTLLPLAGLAAFLSVAPRLDDSALMFWGAALVTVWLLPNLLPALLADSLVYFRARRVVHAAEASGNSPTDAVKRLAAAQPTSPLGGFLGGAGALALAAGLLTPNLEIAHAERAVRSELAGTLAESVDVDPATGRVRVALGSAVPALAGKAILLAPAIDARDQVRWICVAVDIPRALLPVDCR
jgi:hypothetical protein